ncbi:hypothetical protein HY251_19600, partial [bacterium]|nr:hypothetical protein [bacterium]
PGWAWARGFLGGARALALGAAVGIAGLAIVGLLLPRALGAPLLIVHVVLAVILAVRKRGETERPKRRKRALELASFLAVTASFVVLALLHGAPRGWDPSFHALLVERIATTGALPDTWEPWEPVRVHYTLGLHVIVAHVARATGLAPHVAFQGCFPFAYALVFSAFLEATRAAKGSRVHAALATMALGFLALQVRLVYHWGGLPTIVGLGVALGAALALLVVPGRRGFVLGGLLLGSLPYIHHLSALIAWSTALAVLVALATRERSRARKLAGALGVAVIAALPTIPLLIRTLADRGSTSIFHYTDEPPERWESYLGDWGYVLCAFAAIGAFRRGRARRPALAALAFLVGAQVGLDHVYREIARWLTGTEFSALTPTRWLDLASVPLAFLAGAGGERVLGWLGRPTSPRAALLALVLALAPRLLSFEGDHESSLWLPSWAGETRARSLDPALIEAADWARAQLPEDALVVVRARDWVRGRKVEDARLLPTRYWWPYLLRRETDDTPLPASEPRLDPLVLEKTTMATDLERARAVARRRSKHLYSLGPAVTPPVEGARRVGVFGGVVALDELGP